MRQHAWIDLEEARLNRASIARGTGNEFWSRQERLIASTPFGQPFPKEVITGDGVIHGKVYNGRVYQPKY